MEKNKKENRPWGYYEILSSEDSYQVKVITILKNNRLSLQSHKFRSEHWFVIKGKALVTLDKKALELKEGDSVDIPEGIAHRIENSGDQDLVFNEVQLGSYFGEDDIVRYDDDYGRS